MRAKSGKDPQSTSSYQLASPNEEPTYLGQRNEQSDHHGKRVLVADDEPAIRALLEKALGREGYLVDVAADGLEAWRAMESSPYGCYIVDLKMPGLGGRELYQRLQTMDKALTHRFILMTGDTVTSGIRDFIDSNGQPVMEKPLDLNEIVRRVHTILGDSVGTQAC